jgi:hypothetical protein
MPRFRLSTLILATSLIAITWGCAVVPWVTTQEAVSYIKPGELLVIRSTRRPPTAGEIAMRTFIASPILFGAWGCLRLLLRQSPPPCERQIGDDSPLGR